MLFRSSSFIQPLWKRYGGKECELFLTYGSFLFNWYCIKKGITVSLEDCFPEKKHRDDVTKMIKMKVGEMNQKVINLPALEKNASRFNRQMKEKNITDNIILKDIGDIIKYVYNTLPNDNMMKVMADSGTKGSNDLMVQIVAIIGQQMISNERPKKVLNRGKRCS